MHRPLYHFSDRENISTFKPRAPLRHPNSEPLVYAIDEWHSPLYFFPRDCPRVAIWPTEATTSEDRNGYLEETTERMLLFIEESQETSWRNGALFRYEFDALDGFFDTGDIGVWVSRLEVVPRSMATLLDLPAQSHRAGVQVKIVPSLIETTRRFFNFDRREFISTLHVSMIRTTAMPNWPIPVSKPRWP